MQSDKKSLKSTFTIALSGILMALGWILIILSGVLPTGRLFLFLLASFLIATACFEIQLSGAVLIVLGISLLSLAYPGLIHSVIFAAFAGPLPLLIICCRRRKLPKILQYLITHIVMSLILAAVVRIVALDALLVKRMNIEAWLFGLIVLVAFQIVLIFYRYVLLNYEAYYYNRIKPWLHKNR